MYGKERCDHKSIKFYRMSQNCHFSIRFIVEANKSTSTFFLKKDRVDACVSVVLILKLTQIS